MAAAAATALIRSLATKVMARSPATPHRLLASRGLRSSSAPRSGSPPSMPPKDPQTHGSKVVGTELDWAKEAFNKTAPKCAYFLLFSGFVYIYGFINPSLARIEATLDTIEDDIKKSHHSSNDASLARSQETSERR